MSAPSGKRVSQMTLPLPPMQEPVMEITELLRARTEMDYSELLGQILGEWERFKAL